MLDSVVLLGLESSGKSTLFRVLTKGGIVDEANFRGSTVVCRKSYLPECKRTLIDTPGIRLKTNNDIADVVIEQVSSSDTVLLVVRANDIQNELQGIFQGFEKRLQNKNAVLAITFKDKAPSNIESVAGYYEKKLGIPVIILNARKIDNHIRAELINRIGNAGRIVKVDLSLNKNQNTSVIEPQKTWFEHRRFGFAFSLVCLFTSFALPIISAYYLALWLQPIADRVIIEPIKLSLQWLPNLLQATLIGDYGLLTLGWYSFLWAFPVVVFIGVSVALLDETGLKDRISTVLGPKLRKIGLNGQDLIPVLTGFGCNVVAVFQSRGCDQCTRAACVSMISFGSACSYQIGASLSLFGSARKPWLFLPYIFILFFVGALHTKAWHRAITNHSIPLFKERAFLQKPSWSHVFVKSWSNIRTFILQAMPIFLVICVIAAILKYAGILDTLSGFATPIANIFALPVESMPAIIFSTIRKDGLLVLNQGEGSALQSFTAAQVFMVVYLASTLTACLVTLSTVLKEMGPVPAIRLASQQAFTSILTSLLLANVLRYLS